MFVNETSGSALVIVKPRTVDEEVSSRLTTPMTSLAMAETVGGTDKVKYDTIKPYNLTIAELTYDLHCFSDLMRTIAVSSLTRVVARVI